MTPERWQQIEELFHSVAARPAAERAAFLDRACGDDESLRAEVERLLASHDEPGSFMDAPALEATARKLADQQASVLTGKTIGHYQILALLGTGGMGEVHLAQELKSGRQVALKLLRADFTRDQERVRRFQQEARAILALNHPNIVTIYEIGEADGVEFIATEFINGETIRERLARAMQLGEALDVATQVASALADAHAAGIVHRDIKPENIMLRRDGYVKVVDFGLAKLTEQSTGPVNTQAATQLLVETTPGLVMGTARYMSPEQARGTTVDERSDIWSLGVVLFEMVTGRAPFAGNTTSDVIAEILQKEPPLLARYVRQVPEALEWLVSKTLAKDRAERYQTARELLVDLRRLKQRLELARERERSGFPESSGDTDRESKIEGSAVDTAAKRNSQTEQSPEAHTVSSAEYVVREVKRHKAASVIVLLCTCLVLAGAVLALRRLLRNAPEVDRKPTTALSLKSVSTFPGSHRAASFSPDGKRIAFINQVGQVAQIWVKNLAQGDPVQITFDAEQADRPRWSPRNDQIVYVRGSEKTPSIWSVSPAGGTPRKVIEGGRNPNWAGDGARLVFERGYDIWTANVDGSDQRKLEGVPPTDLLIAERMPAFSPDGSLIAFFQKDKGPIGDYWVIPATGGQARRLTFDAIHGGAPVWTPDSQSIIFPSKRAGSMTLWKVPAAGGLPAPVLVSAGEDTEPEISRDGHKLIYTNARNSFILKLTDPGTLISRELKESRTDIFDPSFSPQGDKVLFFAFAGEGELQLFTCDLDGSNLTQLTREKGERNIHPHWSADGSFVYFYQILPTTSFRRISSSGGASVELVAGWEWGTHHGAREDPKGKRVIYTKLDKGDDVATMIRDLETEKETAFTMPLAHPLWSRDGNLVVGVDQSDITICPVAGGLCRKLAPGHLPHWSSDETYIYFWRPLKDGMEIWSIPSAGGTEKKIADLRPIHPIGQFFDVSIKGQLLWVEYQRGRQELWLSDSFSP